MPVERVPERPSDEGLHIAGDQSFEAYGAGLPTNARSFLDDAAAAPTGVVGSDGGGEGAALESEAAPARRVKRVQMSKKMRASMNRIKTKTARLPGAWFHTMARGRPEWELDAEEQELLQDSIETVFEVLDIDFAFQPIEFTFESVWWLLAYPVVAFGFLFLSKKALADAATAAEQPADQQTEPRAE